MKWFIAALAFFLAGCATTVSFQVQRPPALNTLGIKRLAVMPFTTADNSSLQRQAAAWLTTESQMRIQGIGHFTLINAAEIEQARRSGGDIEVLADALFNGQVMSISVQNSSRERSRKDKDGNAITYITYTREVQLSYNYSLTRTRDGSMIGPISKTLKTSNSSENETLVKGAESMVQTLIKNNMSSLDRDIAPYIATEHRKLMRETSNDKILKQRMKDADALVRSRRYKSAEDAFLEIYHDTGSFAAGYNAAILIEVQGDPAGAIVLLEGLYDKTGNPKAAVEISRLYKAMADEGLVQAYKTNLNQQDKVIALMVDTLPSRMPRNPRIAVINNSRNERELANTIVNGIIDGLISKKITVVDRSNQALVEMERNYQYSGNVSDDEMVELGHEAGINAFVLVSIAGSGGSRRLSVRMLDVERSTILYQSPQTDEMNL